MRTSAERVKTRAVRAAVSTARRAGLEATRSVVLCDTGNVVVRLLPDDVVAKVGMRADSVSTLAAEHAIATHLHGVGAPVVPPVADIVPAIDPDSGFAVTLWIHATAVVDHPTPDSIASSLQQVYAGLASSPTPLPSFLVAVEAARHALDDDERMIRMCDDDRSFLIRAFSALLTDARERTWESRALHGEPHEGNRITTTRGVRWIDFESVCAGPLEWDLASTSPQIARCFLEADPSTLERLRLLRSAFVATWCWADADHPDMHAHAIHHLEVLRRAIDSRS